MKTLTDKKETYSYWMKEADTWFSKYIRILYADESGKIKCSCGCGAVLPWVQMQASHFVRRDNMATRYEELNVVPARRECNFYDPDHQEKIGFFISNKFGPIVTINLDLSRATIKYTRSELKEIAEKYKNLFHELKRKKKL